VNLEIKMLLITQKTHNVNILYLRCEYHDN